jgi:hypothetical protein
MTREDQLAELLVPWEQATGDGRLPTLDDLCQDCPELLPDFRRLGAGVQPGRPPACRRVQPQHRLDLGHGKARPLTDPGC